jgi:hypothetical protein
MQGQTDHEQQVIPFGSHHGHGRPPTPRRTALAAELSGHPAAHHEHAFRTEAEHHSIAADS